MQELMRPQSANLLLEDVTPPARWRGRLAIEDVDLSDLGGSVVDNRWDVIAFAKLGSVTQADRHRRGDAFLCSLTRPDLNMGNGDRLEAAGVVLPFRPWGCERLRRVAERQRKGIYPRLHLVW
jgi:hypothetical protein